MPHNTLHPLAFALALGLAVSCSAKRPPLPPPPPGGAVTVAPERLDVPRFAPAETNLPQKLNASYCHWLDVDNDGRPDLLVGGARLFLNRSTPQNWSFLDISDKAALSPAPSLCVDLDNDGWTDIVNTRGQILHNNHDATFTDIGPQMGFKPHKKSLTLAAGDLDGNGFPDILVGMSEDWNDGNPDYYPLQLWLNDGKALTERAKAAGINRATYARSILIHDIDRDGWQDILVANYRLQPNFLWINRGDATFREEGRRRGIAGKKDPSRFYDRFLKRRFGYSFGHSIAAAWLDIDNDGRLDLWISNLVHKYVGFTGGKRPSRDIRGYVCDDSPIYRNNNGFFKDARTDLGIPLRPIGDRRIYQGDELWSGAAVADANNDGFQDVFVPQVYNLDYAQTLLYLNVEGQSFSQQAPAAGLSRIDTYCGTWADVDGDGLMDLATAGRPAVDAPAAFVLFKNTGSDAIRRRPWLGVTLRSCPEGGTAVGAVLAVTATFGGSRPTMVQTQLNSAGGSSYGQQNAPELRVAFPVAPTTVSIRVQWPNGAETTQDAAPGQRLVLQSPQKP